ncbi:hypothetical protein KPL76_03690 [Subtercola sp. PAMC28395]|uniref:hypothetical protein n=1 Tax=Subtercola sp. PAMC28395 TaxID=2846775 RepID=UPI001C0E1696|nr:hypothetical protein [Subtercola sp. PAMC28395]QWT24507.1 hypothetical protein KPL76_03690 [Subtercola sp. PAMC28395]
MAAKKLRGAKPGRRRRTLYFPVDPEAIGRAVDEGALMSRTAATMATMNHIIVGALRNGVDYDADEVARFVKHELRLLSLEQAEMAEHIKRLMWEFPPMLRKSSTVADFQLLTQRRVTYSALASELARLHDDADYIAEAVDSSQKWAWSELSRAIEVRLDEVIDPSESAEYESMREERMRALREIDIPRLARN